MNISQITVRPSGSTAKRILAVIAAAAVVSGASIGAAQADQTWPDHLVPRDEGVAAAEHVWPDHLVAPDASVAATDDVAEFVWPDHLAPRDEGVAAADHVWPDHLVARDGGGDLAVADDGRR